MNRAEAIKKNKQNWDDAQKAVNRGEVVCLSALIGGSEQAGFNEVPAEGLASDGWRVLKSEQRKAGGRWASRQPVIKCQGCEREIDGGVLCLACDDLDKEAAKMRAANAAGCSGCVL